MSKNLKTIFIFSAIMVMGSVMVINFMLKRFERSDKRVWQTRDVVRENILPAPEIELKMQEPFKSQEEPEPVVAEAEPDPVPVVDGPQMY